MIDFDVGFVIPCAGSGERMGSAKPKQYVKILGKPLFLYAVEEFVALKYVKKIALVVDNVELVRCILAEYGLEDCSKISLVVGRSSRHRSVKAGLAEIHRFHKDSELKIVLVHDGVRPLVPSSDLPELIRAAESCGAAGLTWPLVSTVVRTKSSQSGATPGSLLEASLVRPDHLASETPQAFHISTLLAAYTKCSEEELEGGTECLQLVLSYCGVQARLLPGPEELVKVTHKKDLYTVESLIRERLTKVCIMGETEAAALRSLEERLRGRASTLQVILGQPPSGSGTTLYNTFILFHSSQIQDLHLLDFASLIDLDKRGLIIHVIDHASIDGLQSMSVYNLH